MKDFLEEARRYRAVEMSREFSKLQEQARRAATDCLEGLSASHQQFCRFDIENIKSAEARSYALLQAMKMLNACKETNNSLQDRISAYENLHNEARNYYMNNWQKTDLDIRRKLFVSNIPEAKLIHIKAIGAHVLDKFVKQHIEEHHRHILEVFPEVPVRIFDAANVAETWAVAKTLGSVNIDERMKEVMLMAYVFEAGLPFEKARDFVDMQDKALNEVLDMDPVARSYRTTNTVVPNPGLRFG